MLTWNFATEMLEAASQWNNAFQNPPEYYSPLAIQCQTNFPIMYEHKIQVFLNIQSLQKVLTGIVQMGILYQKIKSLQVKIGECQHERHARYLF
jgi:hypothetical protein